MLACPNDREEAQVDELPDKRLKYQAGALFELVRVSWVCPDCISSGDLGYI